MTLPISVTPEDGVEIAARAAWTHVVSGQLRGLTHALGNRVHGLEMSVGAIYPGDEVSADSLAALNTGSEGCAALIPLFRLMTLQPTAEVEAFQIGDALRDAVTLFGHHVDSRDIAARVEEEGTVWPVLAPVTATTQTVLAMMIESLGEAPRDLVVQVSGDEEWTRVAMAWDVPGAGALGEGDAERIARWLLRGTGASLSRSMTPTVVRMELALPTLKAARKRNSE